MSIRLTCGRSQVQVLYRPPKIRLKSYDFKRIFLFSELFSVFQFLRFPLDHSFDHRQKKSAPALSSVLPVPWPPPTFLLRRVVFIQPPLLAPIVSLCYHRTKKLSRKKWGCVKKKYWAALAAGTAMGAWCVRRDRKYPVRSELRFANKLAVPGCVLNVDTAQLANRVLTRMRMALPLPPQGIQRRSTQIPSEDGTMIRLTIYRSEALNWAAPCLVYFHGGGFCLEDAGYIHRYAAQYAEGARCVVVFVHYRTSDIAPSLPRFKTVMPPCAGCGTTLQACGSTGRVWPWAGTAPGVPWPLPAPCGPGMKTGRSCASNS